MQRNWFSNSLFQTHSSTVEKVPYPVSVKLRLEKDVDHTITIMQKLRDVGVKAFTIHGTFPFSTLITIKADTIGKRAKNVVLPIGALSRKFAIHLATTFLSLAMATLVNTMTLLE